MLRFPANSINWSWKSGSNRKEMPHATRKIRHEKLCLKKGPISFYLIVVFFFAHSLNKSYFLMSTLFFFGVYPIVRMVFLKYNTVYVTSGIKLVQLDMPNIYLWR